MKLKHLKYLIQEEIEKLQERRIDMGGQFPGKDIGNNQSTISFNTGTKIVKMDVGSGGTGPQGIDILKWLCTHIFSCEKYYTCQDGGCKLRPGTDVSNIRGPQIS